MPFALHDGIMARIDGATHWLMTVGRENAVPCGVVEKLQIRCVLVVTLRLSVAHPRTDVGEQQTEVGIADGGRIARKAFHAVKHGGVPTIECQSRNFRLAGLRGR